MSQVKWDDVIREFPTEKLRPGMKTINTTGKAPKIDCVLVTCLPSGACHGQHFRTQTMQQVCYLNGGLVAILRETNSA